MATPEQEITAVAKTIIALEEPGPYTEEERKSFYKASLFLKEWGEIAFRAPPEVLAEDGVEREDAIEAAQPILAVSIELIRMAAGAPPTVPREALQDKVRELGQMAIEGLANVQAEAMGLSVQSSPPEEPEGRGFY